MLSWIVGVSMSTLAKSVSTSPGAIALTRIPEPPSSWARVRVRLMSAALLAL